MKIGGLGQCCLREDSDEVRAPATKGKSDVFFSFLEKERKFSKEKILIHIWADVLKT